jgi:anti-sigma regulatory factor (Ser/Thr protein kinase)
MASAELTGASRGHDTPNEPTPREPTKDVREGLPPRNRETLLEQDFNVDNLYGVRAAVAAHVATVADERTVDTMVLIAHELASNAVRHGGGTGRLRLWLAGGALHCEVSDRGTGMEHPAIAGHTLPAPSLPGGRGLWIARQLSEVHISASPAGTTITATLLL